MAGYAKPGLWAGAAFLLSLGLFAAIGLTSRPAVAEVTAQNLANMCQGRTSNPDIGIAMCNMYIAGVTDMHFYGYYETGQRFFCFSEDAVTGEEVRLIFLNWIARNPDLSHQSARYALIESLVQAYPCR